MASAAVVSRVLGKSKRTNKVVIERVTQEKKKLRSVISFHTQPPPGYTFIPAGNPELTQALKDVARDSGRKIYAVTTTPHQKVHELSKEVHRIGFHFPSEVVAEVCHKYGIQLTKAGTVMGDEYSESLARLRRDGKNNAPEDDIDQVTINTKARDAIKDLFPNIPDRDLFMIIKTAFQKGQNKVGTANELTLVRRAQLSVVAHIRHLYTNYDRLLRTVGYHDARGKVEAPTLKKLVEWRGDDENGKKVLEDVMKEVVIITDDENSDDEAEPEEHGETLNINELHEKQTAYSHPLSPGDLDYPEVLNDDGYRYMPMRRKLPEKRYSDEARYRDAAWDRARREFREDPTSLQPIRPMEDYPEDRYYDPPRFAHEPATYTRPHEPPRFRPVEDSTPHNEAPNTQERVSSTFIRGDDGYLYERIVTTPAQDRIILSHSHRSSPLRELPPSHARYSDHQPFSEQRQVRRPRGESPRLVDTRNTIVQSIEGPQLSPTSLRHFDEIIRPVSANAIEVLGPERRSRKHLIEQPNNNMQSGGRKRNLDEYGLEDTAQQQLHKRPYHPPSRIIDLSGLVSQSQTPQIVRRNVVSLDYEREKPVQMVTGRAEPPPTTVYMPAPRRSARLRALESSPPSVSRPLTDGSFERLSVSDHSSKLLPLGFVRRPLSPSTHRFPQHHVSDIGFSRDSNLTYRRDPFPPAADNLISSRHLHSGEGFIEEVRTYLPRTRGEPQEVVQIRTDDDWNMRRQIRQPMEIITAPLVDQGGQGDSSARKYIPVQVPSQSLSTYRFYENFKRDADRAQEGNNSRVQEYERVLPMGGRGYDFNN